MVDRARGKLVAAAAAGLAVGLLLWASQSITPALIITSFASSCATVLGTPSAKASAPNAIVQGHCMSAMIGLATSALMPPTSIAYGIAVGMSIAVMLLTDRLHPPAAANAILAFHIMTTGWVFLAIVLAGASLIAIMAHLARIIASPSADSKFALRRSITAPPAHRPHNLGADARSPLDASGEARGDAISE